MKKISRRARPHTITLYNYVDTTNGVATYQRTVLEWVYLDKAYQQRLSQRGIQTEDTGLLIVDLSDFTATSGRTFIAAELWPALTAQQKALHFTLRVKDDFFVDGAVTDTLPNDTKVTMQGKYRCFAVSDAAIPASNLAGPATLEVIAK